MYLSRKDKRTHEVLRLVTWGLILVSALVIAPVLAWGAAESMGIVGRPNSTWVNTSFFISIWVGITLCVITLASFIHRDGTGSSMGFGVELAGYTTGSVAFWLGMWFAPLPIPSPMIYATYVIGCVPILIPAAFYCWVVRTEQQT